MFNKILKESDELKCRIREMVSERWNVMSEKERASVLKTILESYICSFDISKNTKLIFDNIEDNGLYIDSEMKIVLRLDALCDRNNENEMASKSMLLFSELHEIEHANQYQNNNDMLLINRQSIDSEQRYYITSKAKNEGYSSYKYAMYMLQPLERDAITFACKEYKEFLNYMSSICDIKNEFVAVDELTNMKIILESANELFNTDDAIRDVDNILKTANGWYVEEVLNPIMKNVLRQEEPKLYQKIIFYEIENERKKEEIEEHEMNDLFKEDIER